MGCRCNAPVILNFKNASHKGSICLPSDGNEGDVLIKKGDGIVYKSLNKDVVGLSNVDNTSDINKLISNATQEALNTLQNSLENLDLQLTTYNNTVGF